MRAPAGARRARIADCFLWPAAPARKGDGNMGTQVNVTKMFKSWAPNYVSASAFELGPDAARITWEHALEIADERDEWLVSNVWDACDQVREWARDTGAWDIHEISAWSTRECLALLVQNVASDLRDCFEQDTCVDTYAVCEAYETGTESQSSFTWSKRSDTPGYGHDLMAEWLS